MVRTTGLQLLVVGLHGFDHAPLLELNGGVKMNRVERANLDGSILEARLSDGEPILRVEMVECSFSAAVSSPSRRARRRSSTVSSALDHHAS